MQLLLAHGLEGHPRGTKARHIEAAGFSLIAPDGRGLPLIDRVEGLARAVADAPPGSLLLFGSSYGGLAALALLERIRTPFCGLVLAAPALHWREPPVADPDALRIPADLPAVVVHGVHDAVVPIEVSRRLAARCPHVDLREVDDGHRLDGSLDVLVAALRAVSPR